MIGSSHFPQPRVAIRIDADPSNSWPFRSASLCRLAHSLQAVWCAPMRERRRRQSYGRMRSKRSKRRWGRSSKSICVECHDSRPEAGINLQSALKTPGATSSFLHWKKAVANVKVHDMPPEHADKIPSEEERRQFIAWIAKLKYLAPRDPGPFVLRRLSKVEYGNTLRDLYGVDPSIADSLPDEVVGEGYLNSISPMQSELFLELANKVIDQVTADEGQQPTERWKNVCLENSVPKGGNSFARHGPRSCAVVGSRCVSPPAHRLRIGCFGGRIRSGPRERSGLLRIPAFDVEGSPRVSTVPVHHAIGRHHRKNPLCLWTTTNWPPVFPTCFGRHHRMPSCLPWLTKGN